MNALRSMPDNITEYVLSRLKPAMAVMENSVEHAAEMMHDQPRMGDAADEVERAWQDLKPIVTFMETHIKYKG